MEAVIAWLVGLLVGGLVTFGVYRYRDNIKKKSAGMEADKILNRAKAESAKIDKESKARAKDFEARVRKNTEQEIQKQKTSLKNKESQLERKLKDIEDQQKGREDENEKFNKTLKEREEKAAQSQARALGLEKKAEDHKRELADRLATVSNMSRDQALSTLMSSLETEAKIAASKQITEIEKQAEQEAQTRAKRILAVAISRFASEYTSERTVTVMTLPSDEMKGKIIGREGRNIRTLEALCGVDLVVDETPEAVVISGFDPVRRELAKRTLEKLIEDGRVHPARIEEVVEKVKADLNRHLKEEGEKACTELGLAGLHSELHRVLGSLKYRHSHTQNTLNHSMEVAYLSGLMAAEMGINQTLARRAGLLHDIGKGVEHTVEGNHAIAGADFAKKYGESEAVVHAIRAHHDDEKPNTALALIVQAANILSNSRPGARRPGMDNYIKRLQDLESIGNSFEGVVKTFAVQAGKEIRVIVEAAKVTDDQSAVLARDIARKIEREMSNLGSVKVNVLRESRTVEMAR